MTDQNMAHFQPHLLEMRSISKSFPGVKALHQVGLTLDRGEVLALLGENGAGKSTLMKILAGVQSADNGSGGIFLEGQELHLSGPLGAKRSGIVMIFQELSLVMDLSIAENIYLGSVPTKKNGLIDNKKMIADAQRVLDSIRCELDPRRTVRSLPIAQQQLVEIARAVALGAKIVIFDEPTSSLTDKEKTILFRNIGMLKEQGVGMIYISHKMDEIFEISDRITVLRDGRNSGNLITKEVTMTQVTEKMIGRTLSEYYHKCTAVPGDEVLRVEGLAVDGVFEDVSFRVHSGEVVGLYGLVGAGRTEIVETIFGIRKKTVGTVYYCGKPVNIRGTGDAVKHGICLVPENRKEQGLVLGMGCLDNTVLAKLPQLANRLGVVNDKQAAQVYEDFKEKLSIVSPNPQQKVLNLSGGNQQKIVIAKWLSLMPKLLILDEPTRGIDVGAKSEIHRLIANLANAGMAVLVISSEMPEIMGISNRIIAIQEGRITAELKDGEITEKNLIEAITLGAVAS